MKSRRLINFPEAQRKPSYRLKLALGKVPIGIKKQVVERRTDVRFGSKADICVAISHVRFTPQKQTCAVQLGMSALGQKRTSRLPRPLE
jgi:hypothetical protein